jgi:hypothetical protein
MWVLSSQLIFSMGMLMLQCVAVLELQIQKFPVPLLLSTSLDSRISAMGLGFTFKADLYYNRIVFALRIFKSDMNDFYF